MIIEYRQFKIEGLRIERRDDEPAKIIGHAAVFNSLSENLGGFREKIEPGAFKKAIKKSDARSLFNHDSNLILGRQSAGTLVVKEDSDGLLTETTPPETTYARDLMISIKRGDIQEMSFGFTIESDKWEKIEEPEAIRTILEIRELFDISPVTFPAYPNTDVALRSLIRTFRQDAATRAALIKDRPTTATETKAVFERFDNLNKGA